MGKSKTDQSLNSEKDRSNLNECTDNSNNLRSKSMAN